MTGAESIPAGRFTTPAQLAIPPEQLTVPAFCRVRLIIDTATAEVWLPEAWNGKRPRMPISSAARQADGRR